MDTLLWILASTFFISLASFVGILTLSLKDKSLNKILTCLIALSAGALMGGAFLHLIPEAVHEFYSH
ncbi:MAG: ZIP family metal transporter, partial [Candidatus Aenigmarchaeota archaeon]|nr:ZIP family metal transporter [Candidatus Aenigmarchaeota archaeon]